MYEFLRNNIFYTPEKIQEINEAQRAQAASNPAAQPPAPRQPISTNRSRYSQGGPRPERVVEPPKERTGRDARRGTGTRGRGAELPTIETAKVRGRSGAARGVTSQKTPPTAQPPVSPSRYVTRIGGKEYDLSDPAQKAAYDKVIAADRATRPGQKFADLRGGGGISSRDAEPPTKNPNNIDQKGTIMGRSSLSMEDAQTYVGKDVQIKNPFLSNALPGTNDDGFADPRTKVIKTIDGKSLPDDGISINEYNTRFSNDNKPVEIQKTEGSANLVQSGGVKVNDIEDSSTWTEDYARRRAFLDADDSMSGLKAVQASKGIVYAGGQHNLVNPNAGQKGENDFIKIDRPDAQAYMRGAQGAEDLKAKYIDKIKASKPAPFENVGDTPIASSPVESPINMNDSPADFVAPLTDMPAYTDKDHTGRFNIFRRS